jgi:hypothetical protein
MIDWIAEDIAEVTDLMQQAEEWRVDASKETCAGGVRARGPGDDDDAIFDGGNKAVAIAKSKPQKGILGCSVPEAFIAAAIKAKGLRTSSTHWSEIDLFYCREEIII